MREEVITKILREYGVKSTSQLRMQKGYRNESHPIILNDGQKRNLILYKSEPNILNRIQAANNISNYLYEKNFPTRRTVDKRIIQLRSERTIKYGSLYSYLPGETIPWEAYTMEHIKLLGKTMSDMHESLTRMPKAKLPMVADEYSQILTRMQRYFSKQTVTQALQTKLHLSIDHSFFDRLKRIVRASKSLPNQQPLHMDFVRGNILFAHTPEITISGILDFEKTAYGHPQFDIARTLAFLLVDCKYKSADKIEKYFLNSGYNKRGKTVLRNISIKNTERTLLEELTTLFLVYDFYKFLRHNPYESLGLNEHFVRTKKILISQQLLTSFGRIPNKR